MPKTKLLATLFVAFALLAAACGDDDTTTEAGEAEASPTTAVAEEEPGESEESDDSMEEEPMEEEPMEEEVMEEEPMEEEPTEEEDAMADFPVTIESDGGTWTLESAPQRIVSLSPTATEILFAIGAGDQVVAVDAFSYYPDEAPVTDLSGFDPNVEAVVGFDPDLVVISNDANDLVAALTALDIPVMVSSAPADIEGGYGAMADLGLASGHVDETATAIADLRAEIDAAFAAAPADVSVRIYHELDDTFYSASTFGFVGSVYAQMGAENIADPADTDGYGFPQLAEEYIVEANPELIVITDQVGYTAEDVAARPGWDEIAAVQSGNIVLVNADIASRWGPRLPQFITAVAEALAAVPVAS